MSGDSIVNREEVNLKDLSINVDDWNIPRVEIDKIYKKDSRFSILSRSDYTIKTEERDIKLFKPYETIRLFTKNSVEKHKQKFNYLHIGLVQIGIKPLTREGLDTSILLCLRDCRMLDFNDSLLGTVETSLCSGPIYFDCYPNFTVSLSDQNILDTLTLNIKTHNYKMAAGSLPLSLIYRINYKAMASAFGSKALRKSPKGETLLIQTDIARSNMTIPRTIKWNEISLPKTWELQGAVPPKKIENTNVDYITQDRDGKVEITFTSRRHSVDFQNLRADYSSFSMRSETGLPPRNSFSTAPSTSYKSRQPSASSHFPDLNRVDHSGSIPKPFYNVQTPDSHAGSSGDIKDSPPMSPTFSQMNPDLPELNVLELDIPFEIDKKYLQKDFYSEYNTAKRDWFLNHYVGDKRTAVQEGYYAFMRLYQFQLLFFDWFELTHPVTLDYPFTSRYKSKCPSPDREVYKPKDDFYSLSEESKDSLPEESKVTLELPQSSLYVPQTEVCVLTKDDESPKEDLEKAISSLKKEIRLLKKQEKPVSDTSKLDYSFNLLTSITLQKWFIKIHLDIRNKFSFDSIALVDSGADLNCVRSDLIPQKFWEPTNEGIKSASGENLNILYKLTNVTIKLPYDSDRSNTTRFVSTFLGISNVPQYVILGTPFLELLKPFKISDSGLTTKILGNKIKFPFLSKNQ